MCKLIIRTVTKSRRDEGVRSRTNEIIARLRDRVSWQMCGDICVNFTRLETAMQREYLNRYWKPVHRHTFRINKWQPSLFLSRPHWIFVETKATSVLRLRAENEGGATNKQSVCFIYLVPATPAGTICFVTLFVAHLSFIYTFYYQLFTRHQYVNILMSCDPVAEHDSITSHLLLVVHVYHSPVMSHYSVLWAMTHWYKY